MIEAHLPRRRATKPLGNSIYREAPRASISPNDRQAKLQGRNSAPRVHEIALCAQFHFGRAWRVIRHHQVDRASAQCFPKLLAIFPLANRRTAFELSSASRNLFSGEMQIMRARFDSNRQAE